MRYQIQELGLGGILDQAITLLKNHFGLLVGITVVLLIPFTLIQGFVMLSMAPEMPANATLEDMMAMQAEAQSNMPVTFAFLFFNLFVVIPITNAAIIHAVSQVYLEKTTTIGESLMHGVKK
jgi:hypothetical protein